MRPAASVPNPRTPSAPAPARSRRSQRLLALLAGLGGAVGLLHVPLYGWTALPLDLAVGLLLGGLRMAAGGWGAQAVAHPVADLAGWWLR